MPTAVPSKKNKIKKLFGQDPELLKAIFANLLSWLISITFPSLLPFLLPHSTSEEYEYDDAAADDDDTRRCKCISIGRPGGIEQLRPVRLKQGVVTCGYNISHFCLPPYTPDTILRHHHPTPRRGTDDGDEQQQQQQPQHDSIPKNCILLKNEYFSINYADCCIRWGLYESANRFVGWPIVPGFDVAGTIESISNHHDDDDEDNTNNRNTHFRPGDRVFGCTLFGAYSNYVLIPKLQLRRIPNGLSMAQAASLPAVSLTALYALDLAGHVSRGNSSSSSNSGSTTTNTSSRSNLSNRAILIHSAAGGVGSMLVQMSKLLHLHPIVGVVGSTSKVAEARGLGCHVVIDKSTTPNVWAAVEAASPQGYGAIMDANGVSTFQESYNHLCPTGRLVVFGFHSNLPMGRSVLSPIEWVKMAWKGSGMPTFDPMDMVTSNKSVLAFNLSFFSEESKVVGELFEIICGWLEEGALQCPRITEMMGGFRDVGMAHELLQSGKSIGKIVIKI